MTEERIRNKLVVVKAVMDLYESWFLSGDIESLRFIHNLVAKPLLDEVKSALEDMDEVDTDLRMLYVDESLRSMTCCMMFGQLQAATSMLSVVAADGDLHIASLVRSAREIDNACAMADEVLSMGESWEDGEEAGSYGRLVRIFYDRLEALKKDAEDELAAFEEERERLVQLKNCSIDEYAVEMREDQIADCIDIMAELKDWLDDHPELDPGEGFLSEDDAHEDEDGDDDDDDSDGGVKVTPAGIGIAVLNERLFAELFGIDEEEEEL